MQMIRVYRHMTESQQIFHSHFGTFCQIVHLYSSFATYKELGYRTKRVGKNLYYACIKGRIRGILKYAQAAL